MSDPLIPFSFAVITATVFGALIGSFLNVIVWRVPQGMSIVRPGSACPNCEHALAWYDNVPVLSWLLLGARCRYCREPISARYPLVELATAASFGGIVMGAYAGVVPAVTLPVLLYWAAVGIALALIDLDHHRLPLVIVTPSYVVTAVLLLLASVLTGDYSRLLVAGIGLLALGGLYLALALTKPGAMGGGDVRLAGVLGMLLGWFGVPELIVGGFSAFLIGGVVGVALMLARRAGRKSGIPFGPSMLAGAAVGIFAGAPLSHLYLSLVGLA